jgi:hypothetical protein
MPVILVKYAAIPSVMLQQYVLLSGLVTFGRLSERVLLGDVTMS